MHSSFHYPKTKTPPVVLFGRHFEADDISALKEVFTKSELDAPIGYSKTTALSFNLPDETVRWLVEQDAYINILNTVRTNFNLCIDILEEERLDVKVIHVKSAIPNHLRNIILKIQILLKKELNN